jgi:tetratricopeptide (TPR) repeat protein
MSVCEMARAASSKGLFREALSVISNVASDRLTPHETALKAELFQTVGDLDRAERTSQLCIQEGWPKDVQARGHTTLGEIAFDRGHFQQSLARLQMAVRIAGDTTYDSAQCLLRLLTNCSDILQPAAVEALTHQAARHITRMGDPHLIACFHLLSINLESRRSFFDRARRHLHLGRELLREYPNAWLEGAFAVSSCVVSALVDEAEIAVREALLALECSKKSGHLRTELAALNNLSHIHQALGQTKEARRFLKRCLELAPSRGYVHLSVLDSWVNLELAAGRTDEAEHILVQLNELKEQLGPIRPSWSDLTILQTTARVRIARHEVVSAIDAARTGSELAHTQRDFFSGFKLRLLESEALVHAANVAAASERLAEAVEEMPHSQESSALEMQVALAEVSDGLG